MRMKICAADANGTILESVVTGEDARMLRLFSEMPASVIGNALNVCYVSLRLNIAFNLARLRPFARKTQQTRQTCVEFVAYSVN